MPIPTIALAFAFNIFHVPDPFNAVLFPINLPAWSLFVEMLASLYIVHLGFGLIAWYVFRRRLAWPPVAIFVVYIAFTLALAWLIARCRDPRIWQGLTRRFLSHTATAQTRADQPPSA